MENHQENFHHLHKNKKFFLYKILFKFLGALVFLLAIGIIITSSVKIYTEKMNPNTIVISGTAKMDVVPDISTINFTIRESRVDDNTKALQADIAEKAEAVFSKLKDLGIEKANIKTSDYSVFPKYSYRDCSGYSTACESSYVSGYEASESVKIKIKDTEKVSEVLDILAEEKITEVYGPNFEVDNIEKLRDEVRNLAIQDAREKAKVLANSLGVKIDKIVSFSDSGSSYAPQLYNTNRVMLEYASFDSAKEGAVIAEGEQEVVSNVSITFQIRN